MDAVEMFIKCLIFSMFVLNDVSAVSIPEQNITSTKTPNEVCVKHFERGIHKCMKPFIMASNSYIEAKQQSKDSQNILLKHLCFEYEKMLQCHHSSLANCPTLENIHKVQGKLGTNWVKKVNRLCIIQSDINNNSGLLDKKNKEEDISEINDTKTNINVLDNGTSNKLPQRKNQLNYWKKLQREKIQTNTLKQLKLRNNRDDFDFYSILKHYRHRNGVLTVTDMPSGCNGLMANLIIIITCTCLFLVHISY